MTYHYTDYKWLNGIPYGLQPCEERAPLSYCIVADPYQKHLSIERYQEGIFHSLIYDSALFDFRHLKAVHQTAWEKRALSDASAEEPACEIRDHHGRLILIERYRFTEERCRLCHSYAPHGMLLSVQKISYTSLGDPFNGATLYDANDHQVMQKKYSIDSTTGEFAELLSESWQ